MSQLDKEKLKEAIRLFDKDLESGLSDLAVLKERDAALLQLAKLIGVISDTETDWEYEISSYYLQLGLVNYEIGNVEEAKGEFIKAIEYSPTECDAFLHIIDIDPKRRDQLVSFYTSIIDVFPQWPIAYLRRAWLNYGYENYLNDQVSISNDIITSIKNYNLYYAEGFSGILYEIKVFLADYFNHYHHADLNLYKNMLDQIVELMPNWGLVYFYRSEFGDYQEIINDLSKFIEIHDECDADLLGLAHHRRGSAYFQLGNLFSAATDFKMALDLGTDTSEEEDNLIDQIL